MEGPHIPNAVLDDERASKETLYIIQSLSSTCLFFFPPLSKNIPSIMQMSLHLYVIKHQGRKEAMLAGVVMEREVLR